ncbi:MAG: MATE family efflux transporter [Alphaproteobacteria bacterium]
MDRDDVDTRPAAPRAAVQAHDPVPAMRGDVRNRTRTPQNLSIWAIAWPTMIATLMQTVVRWADVKMVGDLGMTAVAGVTAGGQIYWFIQAVAMALSVGLTALCARAVGAGDMDKADKILKQAIIMAFFFGLFTWLAAIPILAPAIAILGLEQEVVDIGASYLFWIFAGNVPFTLAFVFGSAMRAAGDAITPLWTGLIANALNIFLNWVLIYGNLGAPKLGVDGAGIATSIAMVVQVVLFWAVWGRGIGILKPQGNPFKIDFALWKRIMRIGYPAGIEGAMFHVGLMAFMGLMTLYGTEAFTAYQIGVQVLTLAFLPGQGFSIAASTLVGQHLGAENPDEAAKAGWRANLLSIGFMALFGVILILTAEPIARWFLDDDRVVPLAVTFVIILGLAQPLMAIDFALGGALRGAGDTRFPMVAIFTGLFVCRLVPGALIAYVFDGGLTMLWSVLFLDYTARAILLSLRFKRGKWRTMEI